MTALVVAVVILLCVFPALFLGGLLSAWLEARREVRAGLPVSRPAWENRDKRRALGGLAAQVRAAWEDARHPIKSCWCGRGPLQEFPALDAGTPAGWGCVAFEMADPVALDRHDAAGGYARTPTAAGFRQAEFL